MKSNKISVIIPAFNCEKTLEQTIRSLFDGNDAVIAEVLVCNDCSTDNTQSVIDKLKEEYGKVKVFNHARNQGGAAARNTAARNAAEEYIFCLDSDNLVIPKSLEQLLNEATESDADVAVFRELHFFSGDKENVTHKWEYPPGYFSLCDYLAGTVVPGASGNYLFKKGAWNDVGGYRLNSGALDSWVFGLDLVANGKKMLVSKGGYYLHRYGLESYYVRDSKAKDIGLLATALVSMYSGKMANESWDYIQSSRGAWFHKIDERPVRILGSAIGQAGRVLYVSWSYRVNNLIRSLIFKIRQLRG